MRKTPLQRTGGPKRKPRPQRAVRVSTGVEIAKANKALFKDAARAQRRCQKCGSRAPWNAHHVVYEQHLVKRGHPACSTPNALRLCVTCHELHHKGRAKVTTQQLTDANIEYAFYALGAYAVDYFDRYYDTQKPDVRVARAFMEADIADG